MLNVAIIGCGLIGEKRATAINNFPGCRLKMAYDVDAGKAKRFAKKYNCSNAQSCDEIFSNGRIKIVIVSTFNKFLVPISIDALRADKHVLCEKPPGRNLNETKKLYQGAKQSKGKLKIGFNHRQHPALSKAKELVDRGTIGKVFYIRSCYGHGGRPGYDKEWRANTDLSGGGELIDQGIHILDLFHWFLGDFFQAFGYTTNYFWKFDHENQTNKQRNWEDNAFALLKTKEEHVASLHVSCTQWKNLFSFEIFGKDGFILINGLGGSYGIETLKIGKRKPQSGPPDEEIIKFDSIDTSWREEWKEFISSIKEDREPLGNIGDGLKVMELIDAIYRSAREEQAVEIY